MRTDDEKREKLLQLAKQRQGDRLPPHRNLSEFHNGYYECDYVSPWSISACNVAAEVMLIGQDWVSSAVLDRKPDAERRNKGQDYSSQTNRNLRRFLENMDLEFGETYATNLFPFIKLGTKNGRIPFRDLVTCAERYAIPQIEIVAPAMALCLGQKTFNAVRKAIGLSSLKLRAASVPEPHTCIGSVEIYGLPHPGTLGTNNFGGAESVARVWRSLGQRLVKLRSEDQRARRMD